MRALEVPLLPAAMVTVCDVVVGAAAHVDRAAGGDAGDRRGERRRGRLRAGRAVACRSAPRTARSSAAVWWCRRHLDVEVVDVGQAVRRRSG